MQMRYAIRLVIDYDYPGASDHVRNILRLMPGNGPDQQVLTSALTITPPPDERRDGIDFFGNATTAVAWHDPVATCRFDLTAEVERGVPAPLADTSPSPTALAADLAALADIGPAAPHHFRAPSPRIPPDAAAVDFARAHLRETTLATVVALGEALHAEMRFDAGATDANTPPAVAFANRHGVCQDFAQVMICALRGIGIPAAYISGFLRTDPPPGQPRLQGVDAMHAWVRAWCGAAMGWVEYDPTNAKHPGDDYITVAVGRDYADVAPVLGAIRTAGGQDSRHAVDVVLLDTPAPPPGQQEGAT
jgi:transglutaminase-like putative cysteine protease